MHEGGVAFAYNGASMHAQVDVNGLDTEHDIELA
jgi:hypothetical protein